MKHTLLDAIALGSRIQEMRGPGNGRSFKTLASELGVSSTKLFRAWTAWRLAAAVKGFRDYQHVGVGHCGAIGGLPFEEQKSLIVQTELHHWSRSKLEAVCRAEKAKTKRRMEAAP